MNTERPVAIFGASYFAEVAFYYFTREASRKVLCCIVDSPKDNPSSVLGLPVLGVDAFLDAFGPESCEVFIALGARSLNRIRREKLDFFKSKKYRPASFLSPRASVFPDFKVGENVFIFENNVVQPFASIGDNTILWSGNHIGHHSTVGENCFISSHCVLSGCVKMGNNCFVGVNATVSDNITIGDFSVIGAGALVMKDMPPFAVCAPHATPLAPFDSTRLGL